MVFWSLSCYSLSSHVPCLTARFQITDLRLSMDKILSNRSSWNEDLFVATVKLLTSAALYQVCYLICHLSRLLIKFSKSIGFTSILSDFSFTGS